jgi:molybdopterin/thiamine biosynthesis adenylyltransferase
MTRLHHEKIARGSAALDALATASITVCGAGALGANAVEHLARMGAESIRVIDFDRVEERNLSTQPYAKDDVGAQKATMLANAMYRAVGARIEPMTERLGPENVAELLSASDVVLDCFDNAESRRVVTDWCGDNGVPCVHAGVADGYGEVVWNENYTVPSGGQDDICDYPLARTLSSLVATLAAEAVVRFITDEKRLQRSVTFDDLQLHE